MRNKLPYVLFGSLPLVWCSFDRGDRFWSGKPQPIGIDFSSSHVIAVYAHGVNNFTTLAALGPLSGNEYRDYVAAKFTSIQDWGNDDLLIEDLYDDPPQPVSQQTYEKVLQWWSVLGAWSCDRATILLRNSSLEKFCIRDTTFSPLRPRSRYRHLLSQLRMRRLRSIAPKWFRSPQSTTMTKADLIIAIFEYLERIKSISLAEHGIAITSALISKPPWTHDFDDSFDEACLLAGIEVLEQPHDRVSVATKNSAEDVGPILVLHHGQYHFSVHKFTWNEGDQEYSQRSSMSLDHLSLLWIIRALTHKVIGAYMHNSTEERLEGFGRVSENVVLTQFLNARSSIKFRRDWPEALDSEDRVMAVNLTNTVESVTVLNVTGSDVRKVDKEYIELVKTAIEGSILKHMEIYEYLRSLPIYEELKDLPFENWQAVQNDIVANVTAPEHVGSWIEEFADFVILDSGTETGLLHTAASMAIRVEENKNGGTCVSTMENAAKGVALRAREWIGYWEGWEEEKMYWQRYDEDNSSNWDNEEGELEEEGNGEKL